MIFVLILILGILIFPSFALESGKNAVELSFFRVIPSLFPFFVLQDMAMKMGLSEFLSKYLGKFFYKIFKISDCTPFILGIIGGYPIGAKTVANLYETKKISKNTAEKMLCFCNNAGPAFIVGFVGAYIFSNVKLGYVLLFSHIFASIIIGFILSINNKESYAQTVYKNREKTSFFEIFITSVNSGFSSILSVCGFVIFFSVLVEILRCFNLFIIFPRDYYSLFIGIFEMTTGINEISSKNLFVNIGIVSFLLGFGGMSIHFQTMFFCKNISLKPYFFAKIIHGVISSVISIVILQFLPIAIEVSTIPKDMQIDLYWIFNIIYIALLLIFVFCFVDKPKT